MYICWQRIYLTENFREYYLFVWNTRVFLNFISQTSLTSRGCRTRDGKEKTNLQRVAHAAIRIIHVLPANRRYARFRGAITRAIESACRGARRLFKQFYGFTAYGTRSAHKVAFAPRVVYLPAHCAFFQSAFRGYLSASPGRVMQIFLPAESILRSAGVCCALRIRRNH